MENITHIEVRGKTAIIYKGFNPEDLSNENTLKELIIGAAVYFTFSNKHIVTTMFDKHIVYKKPLIDNFLNTWTEHDYVRIELIKVEETFKFDTYKQQQCYKLINYNDCTEYVYDNYIKAQKDASRLIDNILKQKEEYITEDIWSKDKGRFVHGITIDLVPYVTIDIKLKEDPTAIDDYTLLNDIPRRTK